MTHAEYVRLLYLVPPPVGTLTKCGGWVVSYSGESGTSFAPIGAAEPRSGKPEPDPANRAWCSAMEDWLMEQGLVIRKSKTGSLVTRDGVLVAYGKEPYIIASLVLQVAG